MPSLPAVETALVGRSAELSELTDRLINPASLDRGVVTLLGGDAGVGKTRLLTELRGRAVRAGSRVLIGHCLDLGDSSTPYLPLSEMFARLAQNERALTEHLVAQRPLAAMLMPDFHQAHTTADRGAYFETVHSVVETLAADRPLLVVIEDLHWADRSTRELLTFLFTRDFRAPVSIVVSFRTNDLHRRHPLRPKVAEWSRLRGVHRLTLGPLPDEAMRDLLRQLRPDAPADTTDQILARAAGNPYFAEELLAAGELGDRIPEELADLLLVRVDALDDNARTLIRAASVGGRLVDHAVLNNVVDLPGGSLDAALRQIVDSRLFTTTTGGDLEFRHALLVEAIYDDLLPGERVRLHAAYADALQQHSGVTVSATLARHARAAGLVELAIAASIRAGDDSMAAAGPADAARHYEDALALLAEHPAVDRPADPIVLWTQAVRALNAAGNPYRAIDLATEALAEIDTTGVPGGRHRAGLLVALTNAELLADAPQIDLDRLRAARDELERQDPILAELQAVLARYYIWADDFDASLIAATDSLTVARDLDLPNVVTDAVTTLARLDDFIGDPQRARLALQKVADEARAAGQVPEELRALHQLARVQARMDCLQPSYETFRATYQRAVETGHATDPFAIEARSTAALYALMVGDWDNADQLLRAEGDLPPLAVSAIRTLRMVQAVWRGDPDALAGLPALQPMTRRDMFVCIHATGAAIDHHGRRGDLEAMLRAYRDGVDTITEVWHIPHFDARIRLSALSIGYIAEAVAQGSANRSSYADEVARLMQATETVAAQRRSEEVLGLESRAWLARARAEHAMFSGEDQLNPVSRWEATLALFEQGELRYESVRVRGRLARALMDAGRPERAQTVLKEARSATRRLGLGAPEPLSTGAVPLTPREREVLALVADGRTNGEIATALFISTKTASVHVSNILAKLGAARRAEAAAIALRDGLI